MASRLMNKKEQIKVRDDFMQLDREDGELKLKITDNVKGFRLYKHLINVDITKDDYSGGAFFVIYSYDSTPFTQATLGNYLKTRGYTSLGNAIMSSISKQFNVYINARLLYNNYYNQLACNLSTLKVVENSVEYHNYITATVTLVEDNVYEL